MNPDENKMSKVDIFQNIAQTLGNLVTKADFKKLTELVLTLFQKLDERLTKKVDTKLSQVKNGRDGKDGRDGNNGKDGRDGRDGVDGVDGLAADEIRITEDVLRRIPPPPRPLDRTDFRDGLESFTGNDRLDKSAVKGIEDIEERVNQIEIRPARVGGAKGIGLYVDGAKKLLTAQQINLIAGTGITISYAHASGRNDITITATGTASLTPITVTGDVDDSNTDFTAASAPNLVIVNGASYRDGHGATISGTSITLDNPVGAGGDIYAL